MNNYKLLTPGPLTTTDTVKKAMLFDSCTWDEEYKTIVTNIRTGIIDILGLDCDYTVGLIQGSGTYSVESTLLSCPGMTLVLTNGAYGLRIAEILSYAKRPFMQLDFSETKIIDCKILDEYLEDNNDIDNVAFVHLETTTGILNPINKVVEVCKKHNKLVIVDAMSSLFGVDIDIKKLDIDFIISSSNKCVQGVPGFGIIIFKTKLLEILKNNSPSLSLDLYAQTKQMNDDPGKWRFTSPAHVVLAFAQALLELKEEGLQNRINRYKENQDALYYGMKEIGYETCIKREYQSSIITTFLFYNDKFDFKKLYDYLKRKGFVIYPGKLSSLEVFRIGNIGDINKEDIITLTEHINQYTRRIK